MSSSSFDAADLARQCAETSWVRALARRLVARDDADDLAQEASARAVQAPPRPGARPAWFRRVLVRLAHTGHRAASRRRRHEAIAARIERPDPDPVDLAARLEAQGALIAAVHSLEEPYRAAILLRYFEDLSPRAIAMATGVPVRTVHTRLHRALVMLRARLDGRFGGRAAWIAFLTPTCAPAATTTATTLALMSPHAKLAVTAAACAVLVSFGAFWAMAQSTRSGDVPAVPPPVLTADLRTTRAESAEGAERSVVPAPEPAERTTPAAVQPEAPFVLAGTVYDVAARTVRDVHVRFLPFGTSSGSGVRARTDDAGRFRLELASVQGGHLDVDEPGWSTVYRAVLWGNRDVGELTLVVVEAAPVAGVVVDEAGSPVPEATVRVHAAAPPRAGFPGSLERCLPGEWDARTDGDGRFALPDAPRLTGAVLQTDAPGFVQDRRAIPDALAEVRIGLQRNRALLAGEVRHHDGKPAADVAVFCGSYGTHTDGEGRFTVDLAAVAPDGPRQRQRWLVAAATGFLPARLRCPAEAWQDPASWPQPLVLRLGEPALRIDGRVVDDDGRALEGATVTALDLEPLGDPRPDLPIDSMSTVEFLARVHARVSAGGGEFWEASSPGLAAGGFSVGGLQQRPYRLQVEHSASLRSFVTEPIAAGSHGIELRMPPARRYGAIAGVVRDRQNRPVAQASVWCSRRAGDARVSTEGLTTDAEGRFAFPAGLTADVDLLQVQAPGIAWPSEFPLRLGERVDALDLVVPVRTTVKVEASPATADATAVAFCRRDGTRVGVTITHGNMAWGQDVVSLTGGSSETITVPDDAVEVVVLHGETERGRYPIELKTDEVNRLRF